MATTSSSNAFEQIASAFSLPGKIRKVERFGSGHIHETYKLLCDAEFIVQKFNSEVFSNPNQVMENIEKVTAHIRDINRVNKKKDSNILTFLKASGAYFYKDETGNLWRVSESIANSRSIDRTDDQNLLKEGGKAFGIFLKDLLSFDSSTLHETLLNFHDTPKRYEALEESIKKDRVDRVRSVSKELDKLRSRNNIANIIREGLKSTAIPSRVTHNDTKINNLLFSSSNSEALCVIDLDTVMPGSMLYDFGDLIRTACSLADEDERDLSKVGLNLSSLSSISAGYLNVVKNDLSKIEKDLLYFSAILMTLELSVRFMTDYLNGDTYFRVHREGHNLDRARAQLALVEALEHAQKKGETIISNVLA